MTLKNGSVLEECFPRGEQTQGMNQNWTLFKISSGTIYIKGIYIYIKEFKAKCEIQQVILACYNSIIIIIFDFLAGFGNEEEDSLKITTTGTQVSESGKSFTVVCDKTRQQCDSGIRIYRNP